MIENCYFSVGTIIMRQAIGIPMGIDPAPFWANLFLFYFEYKWMKRMRQTNNLLARKFSQSL